MPNKQPILVFGATRHQGSPVAASPLRRGMYRVVDTWQADTPPGHAAAWLSNGFVLHGSDDVDEPELPEV